MAERSRSRDRNRGQKKEKRRMDLFGVKNIEGREKAYWTKIGAAFENSDGSWNLLIDYIPTDPNISINMREPSEEN